MDLFAQRLRGRLPEAEVVVEPPGDPDDAWWLEARLGDWTLAAGWWPSRGFGLSSWPTPGSEDGSGPQPGLRPAEPGPDEVYRDLDGALERAVALLRDRARTVRPTEAGLRELRELRRVSQGQLASSLGMRQAAISKIEHRQVVDVTLLRRIVASLGGELEIQARFPGYTVRLRPPDTSLAQPDPAHPGTSRRREVSR
jgi:hypothetical protein